MPITVVIIIGSVLIAAIIGIDIYLAADKITGNTWSEIIRMWAKATPIIAWACGVLSGHFFHPIDNFKPILGQPNSIALLIWLSAVVGIVGLGLAKSGYPMAPWMAFIPACIAGALLWPV